MCIYIYIYIYIYINRGVADAVSIEEETFFPD